MSGVPDSWDPREEGAEGLDSRVSVRGATASLLTRRSALPPRHPSAGPQPPCLRREGQNRCNEPRAPHTLPVPREPGPTQPSGRGGVREPLRAGVLSLSTVGVIVLMMSGTADAMMVT